MIQVHGTCVELEGVACLLRGPPGSGKSDLALRLFDHGARLVADDQVVLRREGDRVIASAPPDFTGAIEVRGIGVVGLEGVSEAPLGLVVDLVSAEEVERLPETGNCEYLGIAVLYSCGDLPLPSAILILVAGPRFPPGARTRTARAFNPGFRLRVRAFG